MPSFGNKGFQKVPTHDIDEGSPSYQAPRYAPPHAPPQAPPYYPPQPQFGPYYDNPTHGPQPLDPTQRVIVAPGPQTMAVVMENRPTDWMVPAILACFFCFWPTGICAIMYANRVDDCVHYGDMAEAHRHAKNAKILTIVSIVIGVLLVVVPTIIIHIWVETAVASFRDAFDKAVNTPQSTTVNYGGSYNSYNTYN